jgi:hypothetical protein
VQQDVHNNISITNWGRLEMLFIKPPFEIPSTQLRKNARKAFDKKYLQCYFFGWKAPALKEIKQGKLLFMSVK